MKVTKISLKHKCSSTGGIKSSMTTQGWVAEKAISILPNDPTIGCKELHEKLEETHGTTIGYDKVWRGKDIT